MTQSKGPDSAGGYPSAKKLLNPESGQWRYKVIGESILCRVPYAAVYFMMFERYRHWLLNTYPSIGVSPCLELLSGSAAGGTAVICTYPLELARTKLAFQVENSPSCRFGMVGGHSWPVYNGIQDVVKSVYNEGGVRALYRGVGPTLVGVLPYAGIQFYVYEELKRQIPEEHLKSIMLRLCCGAVAGFLGQTISYPLDVVRRDMQLEDLHKGSAKYNNALTGLIAVIRKEGQRQFFAGLCTNYIKVVPTVAVGFAAYDMMRLWLGVPSRRLE